QVPVGLEEGDVAQLVRVPDCRKKKPPKTLDFQGFLRFVYTSCPFQALPAGVKRVSVVGASRCSVGLRTAEWKLRVASSWRGTHNFFADYEDVRFAAQVADRGIMRNLWFWISMPRAVAEHQRDSARARFVHAAQDFFQAVQS